MRRQYYWHRFFSHQPDLNFENPAVQDAILDVIQFWMDLGIDGIRLDAIPYLFEAEGTNCENLPATHDYTRRVRRMVDDKYPGRILLAEANQWPKDVVAYFGTESEPECHMAFHFPVMPRIYYALREEKAAPISDIMRDTPDIPPGAQWGTFLRNHDELTLEMVTTEERAAMYGWYAPDARMRANIGIRRRLASLLDNSRAELELINALLLSLPGSPYLYYGDEIGMGDNIWLSDRDSVRTPMQWTPDRNAGFSTADPGKLYLPTNQSLVYHFNSVNVEAQLASSSSLLHWTRGMLALRRRHPVFGLGTFLPVDVDNPHVLAFLRVLRENDVPGEPAETILCINNLSSVPQATRIELPEHAGAPLTDLFGGSGFLPVGADGVLPVTMGSRDFYWLAVGPVPASPPGRARLRTDSRSAPRRDRSSTHRFGGRPAHGWLVDQRWYAAKGTKLTALHRIGGLRLTAHLPGMWTRPVTRWVSRCTWCELSPKTARQRPIRCRSPTVHVRSRTWHTP